MWKEPRVEIVKTCGGCGRRWTRDEFLRLPPPKTFAAKGADPDSALGLVWRDCWCRKDGMPYTYAIDVEDKEREET